MRLRSNIKAFLYGKVPGFAGTFPYCGTKVYFPRGSAQFYAAVNQGIFEIDVVRILRGLARPGTTMFDVGANLGLMAIPVLASDPAISVTSFEPSPNTLPFLQRTASESTFSSRWTIVGKAAADKPGTLEFHIASPELGMYDGLRDTSRAGKMGVVKVDATTLDQQWNTQGQPDVSILKIDVEGGETGVLAGAGEMIGKCRPHIVMEWFAANLQAFQIDPAKILSIAKELNYRCYSVDSGVPIEDRTQLKILMLSADSFLLSPREIGG
jgi:FkbM family methyltransferase